MSALVIFFNWNLSFILNGFIFFILIGIFSSRILSILRISTTISTNFITTCIHWFPFYFIIIIICKKFWKFNITNAPICTFLLLKCSPSSFLNWDSGYINSMLKDIYIKSFKVIQMNLFSLGMHHWQMFFLIL